MTLLAADIGNSHTTLGLLDDGEVRDHWRVATLETRTADEWFVLVRGLIEDSTALAHDGARRDRGLRDGPVRAARVARHAPPLLR